VELNETLYQQIDKSAKMTPPKTVFLIPRDSQAYVNPGILIFSSGGGRGLSDLYHAVSQCVSEEKKCARSSAPDPYCVGGGYERVKSPEEERWGLVGSLGRFQVATGGGAMGEAAGSSVCLALRT